MTLRTSSFLLCLSLLALVVLPGFGCRGGSKAAQQALEPITLTYWRVFDDSSTFDSIIEAYRRIHPNVRIEYRKLRYDEYENELLRALAEDRGPDLFAVQNTWMKGYLSLIDPMPDTTRLTYSEERGTLKKETVVVVRDQPTMSLRTLDDAFVQVVGDYAVYPDTQSGKTTNRIFGLPLSVDTMALYYNKDILDAAGIANPPTTWEEFQEAVVELTRYDANGDVAQSGAALGTAKNVERAVDLMSLLMMQSGTQMVDARGRARFAEVPAGASTRDLPSANALRFYTDFANPTKESYTWDTSFTSSFDAFAAGQTAFFFGYSYHAPLLEARAPKLNIGVAPMPQITDDARSRINYANFWLETVSKKTEHADWAWDFLQFATSKEQVTSHLNAAHKPTALRSLITQQSDDATLGVFANQILSAKAWYNGADALTAEKALASMIDDVVAGTLTIEEAISIAQQEVNETL